MLFSNGYGNDCQYRDMILVTRMKKCPCELHIVEPRTGANHNRPDKNNLLQRIVSYSYGEEVTNLSVLFQTPIYVIRSLSSFRKGKAVKSLPNWNRNANSV
jgi:hypothetical protein